MWGYRAVSHRCVGLCPKDLVGFWWGSEGVPRAGAGVTDVAGRGRWVVAARMEWVTPTQALCRKQGPAKHPVTFDARHGVARARRLEATHRTEQRHQHPRERELVDADQGDEQVLHRGSPGRRGGPCDAAAPRASPRQRLSISAATEARSRSSFGRPSSTRGASAIMSTSAPLGNTPLCSRKSSRSRRLQRFRATALPTFFDATTPKRVAPSPPPGANKTKKDRVRTRALSRPWIRTKSDRFRSRSSRRSRVPTAGRCVSVLTGGGVREPGGRARPSEERLACSTYFL